MADIRRTSGQRSDIPETFRRVATLDPHGALSGRVAWSHAGDVIAAPTHSAGILVWDGSTGKVRRRLTTPARGGRGLAFSPTGRAIAGIGYTGGLTLWNTDSGALLHHFSDHGGADVAFAPNGTLLASAGLGMTTLWTVGRRTELLSCLRSRGDLITSVAFDAFGELLATGSADPGLVELWDVARGELLVTLSDHAGAVRSVAFHPDGVLASAGDDHTIKLWDRRAARLLRTLEGHTDAIWDLSFLAGGELLASASSDGALWLWNTSSGEPVATIERPHSAPRRPAVAFHHSLPLLAHVRTRGSDYEVVDVFELDLDTLLSQARRDSVTYTSAKIVLVGDSGVGKTGLGWRLAHGEFVEHASTHGQQFWLLDDLGTVRSDGAQCEAVVWDLAGQPDYRLIHALFLDDADLALIVFDPTRDSDPLHDVDYWLHQLGVEPVVDDAIVDQVQAILVAGRMDRGTPRLSDDELAGFCSRRGIRAFVTTSARTGEGLDVLLSAMREAIAWDERPTTVTTATFKQIKDYVLGLKERAAAGGVVLSPSELRERLEADQIAAGFSDDELRSALGHLSNHGYITRLRTSTGAPKVLLAPELLNNIASSIVLEARRNPKGLGSLEEQRLLSGEYRIPELDSLAISERDVLLDAAAAMFLDRNVCFRGTDPLTARVYLVFPQLINLRKPMTTDEEPIEDGVAYTAIGLVENLYASLVVLLGYTSTFTRASQWRGQARYVVGDGLICGFRLDAEREGELDFVLYFGTNVGEPVRTLFQSLFESFLASRELTIRRYEPVICRNGHQINRTIVREQIAAGETQLFCHRCGERTMLPSADAPIALTKEQAADLRDERHEAERRSRFERVLWRLKSYALQDDVATPRCFISYAWGDAEHERWVEAFAYDLVKAGVDVLLDRWVTARVGTSLPRFVEQIAECDYVVVVGTPAYRSKYENGEAMRGSIVAAEGDLIGVRLTGTEDEKCSVLPVLLDGSQRQSFPSLLRSRTYADFREPSSYFEQFINLMCSMHELEADHPLVLELTRVLASNS